MIIIVHFITKCGDLIKRIREDVMKYSGKSEEEFVDWISQFLSEESKTYLSRRLQSNPDAAGAIDFFSLGDFFDKSDYLASKGIPNKSKFLKCWRVLTYFRCSVLHDNISFKDTNDNEHIINIAVATDMIACLSQISRLLGLDSAGSANWLDKESRIPLSDVKMSALFSIFVERFRYVYGMEKEDLQMILSIGSRRLSEMVCNEFPEETPGSIMEQLRGIYTDKERRRILNLRNELAHFNSVVCDYKEIRQWVISISDVIHLDIEPFIEEFETNITNRRHVVRTDRNIIIRNVR